MARGAAVSGRVSARSRLRILGEAEFLFAHRGFTRTRMADVAERSKVAKPVIVSLFSTKRRLYEAVLDAVFSDLIARVGRAYDSTTEPIARIEAMIDAWLGFVADRPSVARIILREAAEADPSISPSLSRRAITLLEINQAALEAGQRSGAFGPVDLVHWVSTVGGSTVILIAAMPTVDGPSFEPLHPTLFAQHRLHVQAMARQLLGVTGPLRSKPAGYSA